MEFTSFNDSNGNRALFGLLAKNLAYKLGNAGMEAHRMAGAEDLDRSDSAEKAKENQREAKRQLRDMLKDFNEAAESLSLSKLNNGLGTPEELKDEIQAQMDKLGPTKAELANAISAATGIPAAGLDSTLKSDKDTEQKRTLLQNLIDRIDELATLDPKAIESQLENRGATKLSGRHERFINAKERQEGWEKKAAYKTLKDTFELASSQDRFKDMWEAAEGFSGQKQRESQDLFFAMMAERTNGFENAFVLGNDFGNNPEENILNYPFIFNEYLKHRGAGVVLGEHVSLEAIANAKSDVDIAAEAINGKTSLNGVIADLETIIEQNSSAGISVEELRAIPSNPRDEEWKQRAEVINRFIHILNDKADSNPDLLQSDGWVNAAEKLAKYQVHAEAEYMFHRLNARKESIESTFTRAELQKPANQRLLMELAMTKFMKAMEIVDRPMGTANWQRNLHPRVRQMLIASVYDTGVATYEKDRFGKTVYNESLGQDHSWMLTTLSLSPYFNNQEKGKSMDRDHTDVLKAAFLGGKINQLLKDISVYREALEAWREIKQADPNADKDALYLKMGNLPPKYAELCTRLDLKQTEEKLNSLDSNIATLEEFLAKTRLTVVALGITETNDPKDKKDLEAIMKEMGAELGPDFNPQTFLEELRSGAFKSSVSETVHSLGQLGIIDADALEKYERQMYDLQINFMTAELNANSHLELFDALGMSLKGTHGLYLEALTKNPEMTYNNWDQYLFSEKKEDFMKLYNFMDQILPETDAGGKADFMASLKGLYGHQPLSKAMNNPDLMQEYGVAINVIRLVQEHLRERETASASSDRQQKEIEAKWNGMHIGDHISHYVGGVWDMLTGPGQSWANRGAGLVLLYGFYKSARLAMKGDTAAGKALRGLFVAAAAEIGLKEITGKGILDRAGMDLLESAMEGTYEQVLAKDGAEYMDEHEIDEHEHQRTLQTMKEVPFHELMEWYDKTDEDGAPLNSEAQYALPEGISANDIIAGDTQLVDKKKRASFVLRKTMDHFFNYVGDKNNHIGPDRARLMLEEKWITLVDDPKKPWVHSRDFSPVFSQMYKDNKDKLTWQVVMRSEIDPQEVELTKNQTLVGQAEEMATEAVNDVSEWVTEYVYNPGSGYAEEFFEGMGENAQSMKDSLAEIAEYTGSKIHFTKEGVKFWYDAHEYEIKQVAEDHWNLVVTAVKLPFQAVLAADNIVVPFTLSKLKQTAKSLNPGDLVIDRDININDVVSNMGNIDSNDRELNPEFTYYGMYQKAFLEAISNSNEDGSIEMKSEDSEWFYENEDERVGYYVSKVQGKANENKNLLLARATKQAEEFYRTKNIHWDDIHDFMDEIQVIHKTTNPPKVYVFYRMPLADSPELYLKKNDDYPDDVNANRIKDRAPWKSDPSKTTVENLVAAWKLDMGPARVATSEVTGLAEQIPRFAMWNMEKIGDIAALIGGIGRTDKEKREIREAIEKVSDRPPALKQTMDEILTGAKDPDLAASDFYKDKTNALIYRFSLDFAQRSMNESPLYTGLLVGRTVKVKKNGKNVEIGYESSFYTKKMNPQQIANMVQYYNETWSKKRENGKSPELEQVLNAKLAEEEAENRGF